MKITIKDIARRADVSPGTVSKIITGKYKFDNVKISEETIGRVNRAVREMNYEPDYGARVLSTGRTFTIGICMPKSKHKNFHLEHYYSRIIDRIEKEAVNTRYDLLLVNYDAYVNKFNTRRIDGLIIIEQWEKDREIEELRKGKGKFVVINNLMDDPSRITSVNIDNKKGMEEAAGHFRSNGHTALAFIGELIPNSQWKEQKLRLDFFDAAMKKEGMSVDRDLFLLGEHPDISGRIKEQNFDQMSGYYGMEYLLEKKKGKFTGVLCANDLVALGAVNYLYEKGLKPGKDVSLIGFDDLDFSAFLMGGLTTIRQPFDELGRRAFRLLLEMVDEEKETEPRQIVIPPELVVRSSVARIS